MDDLTAVQAELSSAGLDAWLIYDFRGSNPVARPVLGPLLEGNIASRRVFLKIPARGVPTLLVHAIEVGTLKPDLGVEVKSYSSRQSLDAALGALLEGCARVAMEYSPGGDNPYVGTVDAGTLERVRSHGVEVVSSAEVAQTLELWSQTQLDQHLSAAEAVLLAKDAAFAFITERLRAGQEVRETQVQRLIADTFEAGGFIFDHPATVSFGAHAGDPHYSPLPGARDANLKRGDVVLVDLWCKVPQARAPYADITWMGVYGPPAREVVRAFAAVTAARDAAFRHVAEAFAAGRAPTGGEVDRVARSVLDEAGYAASFTHRTGHSLGVDAAHGLAAHLDDFETADTRLLRVGLGFTIEPGVYLPTFGVRSEINVYIDHEGPRATTDLQAELEVLP
ncbi:MAG TPA: M24 family metallopeptidase [Trueperaceae bacterium]|nr:M24 family metallopeptidase [Trueperaceae bacterium]